jgi:RNase P protein component
VKYEFRVKREVKASFTQKGNEMKIVLIADRGFGILDSRRIFGISLYRFRRIENHANVSDRNE